MDLKSFVDFAYSMVNMDEVRDGKFILPKEIVFNINDNLHRNIEKEVLIQKGIDEKDITHFNEFDVEIFDINFKFISDAEDTK